MLLVGRELWYDDWEGETGRERITKVLSTPLFLCLSSNLVAHSAVTPLADCWLELIVMLADSGTLVTSKYDIMDQPSVEKAPKDVFESVHGKVEALGELEKIFSKITLQEELAKELQDHAAKTQKRTVIESTLDTPSKKKQRQVWKSCANPRCKFTCSNYNQPKWLHCQATLFANNI